PRHARQGGQEAAIDRDQLGQRGLLGQRELRAQVGPQRDQHLVQQRSVKDIGRFTQGTQGRGVDAKALLHRSQGRRLLQAAQAGHHRVKKVQQQQTGILIVEQLPVPGAVPLRRGAVEVVKERAQQAKIFEPLEGLLWQRGRKAEPHVAVLLAGKRDRRWCASRKSLAYSTIA